MFSPTGEEAESSTSTEWPKTCCQFTLDEIQLATQNFDESLVIGRGGFGKVYKGTIVNVVAAIKRLDSTSNQGAVEFRAEVEMLTKLRHCHIVSLIGYCNDGQEMILVYEYMPNGTLEDHLHKLTVLLSWMMRLKICIGAARGLDYLHTGTGISHGVIHRDVKSSNILLDKSWAAKISDFGLSKIGPTNQPSTYVNTNVKGTFGYLDPEYFYTGRLTRKSDVYAFGVILFENLCGKRAVDSSIDEEQWGLARWAQDSIKEGRLKLIVDCYIKGQISPKCLKEFARLADCCLHSNPKQRPTMAEVVATLECILALQEKANNTTHPEGMTIFGRRVPIFLFPSNGKNSGEKVESSTSIEWPKTCSQFTLHEIKSATQNFDESLVIGSGEFGKVYRGTIVNGASHVVAAIRRLKSTSDRGALQFWADVEILAKLRHSHLLSFIGYCNDGQEMILVYEYMPHGTLEDHLHKFTAPLSWMMRLKICIGAARGLDYLHTGTGISHGVTHCDVKSSNIFLNNSWAAKISDFRLPKIGSSTGATTLVKGTLGYLDPDFFSTGRLTRASDVYAFGVVLFENLCGKRAMDESIDGKVRNLAIWAHDSIKEGRLKLIVNSNISGQISPKCLKEFARLADCCLDSDPKQRPTMAEVVVTLESIQALQEEEKTNNTTHPGGMSNE